MTPHHRWMRRPAAPSSFLRALPTDVSPLVGTLLWNRNVTDLEAVDRFLYGGMGELHNPMELRDMDRAVARIRLAAERGERLAVYGDYDTDGVTGVTLLHQVLTGLNFDVVPYIPRRFDEGYGLNIAAIEQLAGEVQLLITVDCGISNVREVARARELGLDVIILDHHQPPANLPAAWAVINPKRPGCAYPYKQLAGVGVAYKLVQALHRNGLKPPFLGRQLLDVVALGTVSDMVPLDGENRVLVKFGLEAMNRSDRAGLRALIEVSGVKQRLVAQDIGFKLGPRINAAGRLDDAIRAYNLLLCGDPREARLLADELNSLNRERQVLTKAVQKTAYDLVIASGKQDRKILVLDHKDFPSGVVGLVAGRLVETFGRPVLLLERGEEVSRGSARSVNGFSIVDALAECGDVFEKYGGHAMAAGFSIRNDRLPELETRLAAIAARDLTEELLAPKLFYDAELPLSRVTTDLVADIDQLEPFGQGNPEPVWVSRNVRVVQVRTMGSEQQHLKLNVRDGLSLPIEALLWGQGQRAAEFRSGTALDIAYTIGVNDWGGRQRVQIMVKDVATPTATS